MDDGGWNQAEAGAGALGLRGGGVGGVPEGDHCLLLHPHPHHCQLLGRLLLYKGQRGEINFNSVVVAYFCTFHTSHFFYRLYYDNNCVSTCMLLTVCQHAMWICQHATYIVDMQEKCVIMIYNDCTDQACFWGKFQNWVQVTKKPWCPDVSWYPIIFLH